MNNKEIQQLAKAIKIRDWRKLNVPEGTVCFYRYGKVSLLGMPMERFCNIAETCHATIKLHSNNKYMDPVIDLTALYHNPDAVRTTLAIIAHLHATPDAEITSRYLAYLSNMEVEPGVVKVASWLKLIKGTMTITIKPTYKTPPKLVDAIHVINDSIEQYLSVNGTLVEQTVEAEQ